MPAAILQGSNVVTKRSVLVQRHGLLSGETGCGRDHETVPSLNPQDEVVDKNRLSVELLTVPRCTFLDSLKANRARDFLSPTS